MREARFGHDAAMWLWFDGRRRRRRRAAVGGRATSGLGAGPIGVGIDLELELIQSHIAQKPMLRGEGGARAWRV